MNTKKYINKNGKNISVSLEILSNTVVFNIAKNDKSFLCSKSAY